jgi:hypothetical protein
MVAVEQTGIIKFTTVCGIHNVRLQGHPPIVFKREQLGDDWTDETSAVRHPVVWEINITSMRCPRCDQLGVPANERENVLAYADSTPQETKDLWVSKEKQQRLAEGDEAEILKARIRESLAKKPPPWEPSPLQGLVEKP